MKFKQVTAQYVEWHNLFFEILFWNQVVLHFWRRLYKSSSDVKACNIYRVGAISTVSWRFLDTRINTRMPLRWNRRLLLQEDGSLILKMWQPTASQILPFFFSPIACTRAVSVKDDFHYYIDGRIYLNLSKSVQTPQGWKLWSLLPMPLLQLNVQIVILLFTFVAPISTFIFL